MQDLCNNHQLGRGIYPMPKFLKSKEGIVDVKSKGSKSTPQCQPIVGTPEKTFVSETQNTEKSPEEIARSFGQEAEKRVSKQVTIEVKGECRLCGRGMSIKVLQKHTVYCNGSNRSSLTRICSDVMLRKKFLTSKYLAIIC